MNRVDKRLGSGASGREDEGGKPIACLYVYGVTRAFLETGVKADHPGPIFLVEKNMSTSRFMAFGYCEPSSSPYMRNLLLSTLLLTLMAGTACSERSEPHSFPRGDFMDDYGMIYSVTDSTWSMSPGSTYLIDQVAYDDQVLILKQPATDSTSLRFTRVDWMLFEDMEPWTWGYCYAGWDLPSREAALNTTPADRTNPRSGCGGFPFSRMKKNG